MGYWLRLAVYGGLLCLPPAGGDGAVHASDRAAVAEAAAEMAARQAAADRAADEWVALYEARGLDVMAAVVLEPAAGE